MILALEASTSSAKGILYDQQGTIVSMNIIAYDKETAKVVWMDAEKVFETLMRVAEVLVVGHALEIDRIVLVSIWNSLLFLDENMRPTSRVKTWADTGGQAKVLEGGIDDSATSGCPKHFKFTRWKLLRENEQKHLKAREKIATLPEFIFFQMTGEWLVSEMVASGSGMYDLKHSEWNKSVVSALDIAMDQLPTLVDWHTQRSLIPGLAARLGLASTVMVTVPGADGGMNQYAESGFDTHVWSMSVGTSAALRCMSTGHDFPKGLWCHCLGDDYYVIGAAISGAGNCVQWFKENIYDSAVFFMEMETGLSNSQIKDQPYYLPFIYGEQSPGWVNHRNSGYSAPIENYETIDLYYSLLEGILFNLYQGYESLVEHQGMPTEIVVSGGIVRSEFWLQLAADILHQTLRVSTVEHSSLSGAVRVAIGQKKVKQLGRLIQPNSLRHDELMKRYEGYLAFYHNNSNQ